jgi:hypothetical protein
MSSKKVATNTEQNNKNAELDYSYVYSGLVFVVICTRLPIEEATARLNCENPTGIASRWQLASEEDGKPNHRPCPTNPKNTHYLFEC